MIGRIDTWIVERVFQKIIDRYGMDPRRLMWSCHRLYSIGILGTTGIGMGMAVPTYPNLPIFLPMVFVVAMVARVWMIRVVLSRPSIRSMVLNEGITYRLTSLSLAAYLGALWIAATVQGKGTTAGLAVTGLFCASCLFDVAAVYLHSCRNPPPGRQDGARSVRFSVT